MESRWITTTGPTTCLACRKPIPVGSRAYSLTYSLTGSERDVYCERDGVRAEVAMNQHRAHRERERRIIAGLPV